MYGANPWFTVEGQAWFGRDLSIVGNIVCRTVRASQVLEIGDGSMWWAVSGSDRQLNFASGYWIRMQSSGQMIIGPNNLQMWACRPSDRVAYNNVGSVAGTSWFNICDQRLKENIRDDDEGLKLVRQMRPKRYRRKIDKGEEFYFIAQDIQKLMPDAVRPIGELEGEPTLGINEGAIVACLVNAVRELHEELQELKGEHNEHKEHTGFFKRKR
jgi:hypothetical protein